MLDRVPGVGWRQRVSGLVRGQGGSGSLVSPIVIGLAVLAVVVGLILMNTSDSAVAAREADALRAAAANPGVSAAPQRPRFSVTPLAVSLAPVQATARLSAVLGPVRQVSLAAEVAGAVVEVPIEENALIEQGAVLLRLEPTLLAAAVEIAEAQVLRAQAEARLARTELKRQQGLAARNATSQAELTRAESADQARRADVKQARASLAEANQRLNKADIRAPFTGVIRDFDLEPGAYVRVGDVVADVLDLSQIEIEVNLTDYQVVNVMPGEKVGVEVDVFPGSTFSGVIHDVALAADNVTQRFAMKVRLPNDEGQLLPGMLGRVILSFGRATPAIQVPRRTTQSEWDLSYVYVLEPQDREGVATVRRRRVQTRTVPFRSDLLEVIEGLEPGERIATTRVADLRDGMTVGVEPTP